MHNQLFGYAFKTPFSLVATLSGTPVIYIIVSSEQGKRGLASIQIIGCTFKIPTLTSGHSSSNVSDMCVCLVQISVGGLA